MARVPIDRPDVHYDNISQAWRYLMGESFHYGYFDTPETPLDEATQTLTARMAEFAQLDTDNRVLDVGCGIGGPALYLAERFGCTVTGISTSEVGINAARERAASRGLDDKAAFHVRDGMANAFEDASFDRAWVMESSHLMPDKPAMIKDSARVLEYGGRIVLCDIIMHRELPMTDVLKRAKAFDLLRVVFGRAKMVTLANYREWFEAAGLEVERCDDISTSTAPTFDRWRSNADRYRSEVSALVGEKALADFAQSCVELEQLWDDEILGYGMMAAQKVS